ncbi:MAG TPA: porin [Lacipirellulaceae bacterium]|nr:porin [Lacipirellulaceae bacterium]
MNTPSHIKYRRLLRAALFAAATLATAPALLAQHPSDDTEFFAEACGIQPISDVFAVETSSSVYESQAASWLDNQNAETEDAADGREEKTIAERLEELESKHADLQEAHDELKSGLNDYAKSGHSAATMSVNGRLHIDMWQFLGDSSGVNGFETGDNDISPADRLEFRRMRFGVRGDIWHNMEYRIEMELAGGNDPEFRDAYLGWTELPLVQTVRLGNQKRPYGLEHWNSTRYTIFMERPFIIEAFNQDSRRLGIQSWSYSEDLAWNWQYGVFNQRLIQDEGVYISDHWQGQVAGRLANTIWYDECSEGRGYAHWAVAGTWADTDENQLTENYADSGISEARFRTRPEARTVERWLDTGVIAGAEDYSLLALENVINFGPLQLVGEYQNVWLNRQGDSELHFHGGYIQAAYFLTGEHMPWDRETGQLDRPVPFENFFLVDTCDDGVRGGCGAWQVAARWSYGDLADDNIQGGIGESITLGLNWLWNPWARMQFNYIYGNIHDNAVNAAGGIEFGDYHILGTRFMVDF